MDMTKYNYKTLLQVCWTIKSLSRNFTILNIWEHFLKNSLIFWVGMQSRPVVCLLSDCVQWYKHREECGKLQKYHGLAKKEICLLNNHGPINSVIFDCDLNLMLHSILHCDFLIIPEKRSERRESVPEVTEGEISCWAVKGSTVQNPLCWCPVSVVRTRCKDSWPICFSLPTTHQKQWFAHLFPTVQSNGK
jgi:hypothetical protein